MKKRWIKILALALVGVVMLCMTACDQDDVEDIIPTPPSDVEDTLPLPTEETEARAVILEAINAYRAELSIQQLKEEPELDELLASFAEQFEAKNTLSLPDDVIDWDRYCDLKNDAEEKWKFLKDVEGFDFDRSTGELGFTLKFEYTDLLTLKKQIKDSKKLNDYEDDSIGIVLVEVDNKLYWTAQTAKTIS